MNDFDWVNDIPSHMEMAEEYRELKIEAVNNQDWEKAGEYRDLERKYLGKQPITLEDEVRELSEKLIDTFSIVGKIPKEFLTPRQDNDETTL